MSAVATRPSLEVADILRAYGEAYDARHPVSALQAAVMQRLARCRTAALGGHIDACDRCGYTRVSYNSCRDRHCPKCQARKRAEWLEARLERLLPVEYFHVVFTLPATVYPLMLHHPRRLYDLLFRAAAQSLLTLAADPQRLGAQIGVTAILHTWGQNLMFHPHLHCVVTGGGLSPDGSRWIATRPGYLFPVKVLGRLFRGKFLAGLKHAYQAGQLSLGGSVADLADQAGISLPGPLFPPRGYCQLPFARPGRRPGAFPLAGLRGRQPPQGHAASGGGIHPPVPAPCTAQAVRSHSPLRTPGRPQRHHPVGPLPTTPGRSRRPGPGGAHLAGSAPGVDPTRPQLLPPVPGPVKPPAAAGNSGFWRGRTGARGPAGRSRFVLTAATRHVATERGVLFSNAATPLAFAVRARLLTRPTLGTCQSPHLVNSSRTTQLGIRSGPVPNTLFTISKL